MRRETQEKVVSFVAPPQPVPIEQKLLSTGQRLVGVGVGQDSEEVDLIKRKFAEITDFLIELEGRKEFANEHHKLLHNHALMQITSAAQFTTKVLTYKILD